MIAPTEQDIPTEQDVRLIKDLETFLDERAPQHAQLVGPTGETRDIPEPLYRLLRRVLPAMAQGAAIGVFPIHQELTTQQAADLLNISRPSFIKLLDGREIPYERSPGGHRRVRFADVLAYKQRRSQARHAALADIAAIGQQYGAYDTTNEDLCFGINAGELSDEPK
jgi:excisionase family DNA binding protein